MNLNEKSFIYFFSVSFQENYYFIDDKQKVRVKKYKKKSNEIIWLINSKQFN